MLSYADAVARLYDLGHELARMSAHKFDLAHMRVLLSALDDPQRRFRSVLIAGTNGKGSTAATLAAILEAAGHRTGLYTSPHLVRINERVRVNGREIADADFARLYDTVEQAAQRLVTAGELPWHPSFFEMLTAIAFLYFAEVPVEIAVLEVGMGGRLDATNVVDPLLSIITDISLDHQKYLGNTIREIAREKAGIIRPRGIVVTLPQHPEANEVLGNTILECGAEAVSAVPYVPPVSPGAGLCGSERTEGPAAPEGHGFSRADTGARTVAAEVRGPAVSEGHGFSRADTVARTSAASAAEVHTCYPLEVMGQQITVNSPLIGRHQLRNLALAIAAAEQLNRLGINISPHDIESGIRQTRWPGRFQIIPPGTPCSIVPAGAPCSAPGFGAKHGSPELVLDVAHNPAGAWALRAALSARYGERPLTFVFGVMRDKAMREIAEILFPLAARIVAAQAANPRAATAEEIRAAATGIFTNIDNASTVAAAVERACSLAGPSGVVVITGSIYIVGEALAALHATARAERL